jgi:hypothetical protein
MEILNVNEQQAEQTHGEGGSVGMEPAVPMSSSDTASSDTASSDAGAPVTASGPETTPGEAPAIAPDHEAPKDDTPEETPKETPKIGTVGMDAVKAQTDASKLNESFLTGRLLVKSPGKRGWQSGSQSAKVESEPVSAGSGMPRFAGIAALVALAVLAGAVSGAMATIGVMHFVAADAAVTGGSQAVEASVSRIDADILALKADLEHATKTSLSQFNKANDRLDKIEKAQTEPAAKLAKLSEAMDRLHIPPAAPATAAVATPAATRDITGSVTPAQAQANANAAAASSAASVPPAPAPPKTEAARLPTVDGWVLRDVKRGGALIEGRQGLYEVYAGDPVPGLGKVDAIRKQDGRWVVVTSKGLVVAR